MESMFNSFSSLTSLNISNFDTKKAPHLYTIFSGSKLLSFIDISSFNTSHMHIFVGVFSGVAPFGTIIVQDEKGFLNSLIPKNWTIIYKNY